MKFATSVAGRDHAASSSRAPAADWRASRWRTCSPRTAAAPRIPSSPIRSRPSSRITRPKAKSVIWLFMEGGPSHIDLFDPKPKLNELDGQPMPASFGEGHHGHGHGATTR